MSGSMLFAQIKKISWNAVLKYYACGLFYAAADSVVVATETGAAVNAHRILRLLPLVNPTVAADRQSKQVTDMMEHDSILSLLDIFCNDDYWERVWVVQEFAIGHRIQFLIGDGVVAANKLQPLVSIFGKRANGQGWAQAEAIYSIRSSWQKDEPLKLLQLLEKTRASQCGKRHDRVFGLLGLSTDAFKYISEPNYETDLVTATLAMTRAYIKKNVLDIIFLAPHCENLDTPSWSPKFFYFDRYPPEKRIIRMLCEEDVEIYPGRRKARWMATGSTESDVSFRERVMLTPSRRIGAIRSVGRAWLDPVGSEFPTHDPAWSREVSCNHLSTELYALMLKNDCERNPDLQIRNIVSGRSCGTLAYSFVRVFLPSHGAEDLEYQHNALVKWICGNRGFFTGARTLEGYASQISHPMLTHGINAWNYRYWGNAAYRVWARMERMAETNMRLMCLDAGPQYRMGWAATGARLHDEVFLIPGCSSPVILRRLANGQYQVVGDAIVTGAMDGTLWETFRAEDLQHIEIA